jgi:predicted metal-dependent peptidase
VAIAIDTSGSIDHQQLKQFLTESQQILQSLTNAKLLVIDCDSKVQQVTTFEAGESLARHEFLGGGGTDFRPAFEEISKYELDVMIYFTDGQGRFPEKEPHIPVVWVLTSNIKPPFGAVVNL